MKHGLYPLYPREGKNSGHGGTSSIAARYEDDEGAGAKRRLPMYSVATAKGYGTRQPTKFPHGPIPSLFTEPCIDSSAARIF